MNRMPLSRIRRQRASPRARSPARVAAVLATALVPVAASALEIMPLQGRAPEQVERDQAQCMALAREATDAGSGDALRISDPVLGSGQPIDVEQEGEASSAAGEDRPPGLFGGLRHGKSDAAVQWRTRREAELTRIEDELERAYAACVEARGYSVKPRP